MRTGYTNHPSALAALLLLSAGAVLAGCGADTLFDDGVRGNVVVVADIDNGHDGTRTCIDPNTYSGNVTGVLWTPDDRLGVFGTAGTANAPFSNVETSAKRGRTSFTGTLAAGEEPQYAYYPFSEDNSSRSADNLQGTVHGEQTFSLATGLLSDDWKYGTLRGTTDEGYEFKMKHLFAMAKVDISATGTALEGQQLDYITLTVTPADASSTSSPARRIHGDFTFNATNGSYSLAGEAAEGDDVVKMTWSDRPQLTSGAKYTGYLTLIPDIHNGDQLTITVATLEYAATYKVKCKVDFQSGSIYTLPLDLTELATKMKADYNGEEPYVRALPAITSLKFTVAGNEGKILDKKLQTTVSSSKYSSKFVSVSEETATISADSIGLTIPYLYDHKLVPTFKVPEGAVVTANGQEIKSGETEVDWAATDRITVTAAGDSRTYRVHIGNTGLPVVVIKQSSSGNFDKVTTGGFLGIGATTVNQFVDFMVRGKDTDWVEDDEMTVYNADGTVDMPMTLCGVRLRGNSTQKLPKKPFAIKLTQKQKVLGMPSHKRWCLMANWLDRSMIRNLVGFAAANATTKAWKNTAGAAEGITWNPSGKSVELVIDGRHVGNYLICEQIKIGSKRLNINDNYEDLTADAKSNEYEDCGYLVEFDVTQDEKYKGVTSRGVTWQLKDDVLPDDYRNKIQTKIQAIEDAIKGGSFETYSQLIDIPSAIDQWLIWELALNREYTEPRSIYGYFNGGNDKLHFGPVWDFDRGTFQNPEQAKAMGSSRVKPWNAFLSSASKISRRGGYKEDQQPCMWYPLLMDDAKFVEAVQKRWTILYPYLQQVVSEIERLGRENALSWKYDSEMWPGTASALNAGYPSGFSDFSGDENLTDYPSVIKNLINCYNGRLEALDALIRAGNFKVSESTF